LRTNFIKSKWNSIALKDISMDVKDNYFKSGYCCDFRGLIKPASNWGIAGLFVF